MKPEPKPPRVELRAPALTPERKSVLCPPAQHGAITANSFWGQGQSPWLLAVRVLKKAQDGSFMSAKFARRCSLFQGVQSSAVLSIGISNCLPRELSEAPAWVEQYGSFNQF